MRFFYLIISGHQNTGFSFPDNEVFPEVNVNAENGVSVYIYFNDSRKI